MAQSQPVRYNDNFTAKAERKEPNLILLNLKLEEGASWLLAVVLPQMEVGRVWGSQHREKQSTVMERKSPNYVS